MTKARVMNSRGAGRLGIVATPTVWDYEVKTPGGGGGNSVDLSSIFGWWTGAPSPADAAATDAARALALSTTGQGPAPPKKLGLFDDLFSGWRGPVLIASALVVAVISLKGRR